MSGEEPPRSDEFDPANTERTDETARTDDGTEASGGESGASAEVIDELFAVIEQRKVDRPEGSYTASLFDHEKGENAVLEKIGEEATEVILAAKDDATDELAAESADLVYHLLVLLSAKDLDVETLYAELESRR